MFDKIKEALESEKEKLLRELSDINARIERISSEIQTIERKLEEKQKSSKTFHDIVKLKSLFARISRLKKLCNELEKEAENLKEKIRLIEKDIKSLDIITNKRKKEEIKRKTTVENLNLSYFHLIKKKVFIVAILLFLCAPLFPLSATQERVRKDIEESTKKDLQELVRLIEERIKLLKKELKRLEEIKKSQKREKKPLSELQKLKMQKEKEIQKLVKAVNKADPDEIAPALENLSPELAAEILLRLKEKKAGQILANMNPEKAAKIIEVILKRNPNFKLSEEEW